ncbi:flagellar basal body L-ring protein FlgH [Actomonas aquatica]|uniref:Flagellar basal body L-ring protein FlgH n=1 Tax=Actomonas aquatica TaxID=2866162 RepID=A0ABZ1C7N9_9BACT|nr:flagellar basal body L-ring protein FlgH [Opitutus sp. WL0086]WRQ87604.1 flagellar basal body L-ring protein FlgH [Opitutus sp. WL0086]
MNRLCLLRLLALCTAPIALAAGEGSLWNDGAAKPRAIYADRVARTVGDILTVQISESVSNTASTNKQTGSGANVSNTVAQFLFPGSNLGTHNGSLPGTAMSGSNDFQGGGQVSASQSLTGRAAVMVIDVLPNGVLVIEGVRRVTFAGETQHAILHGLVRPDDVNSSNVVFSSDIANARVEFVADGALTEAQRRGWITRLYEIVRPY